MSPRERNQLASSWLLVGLLAIASLFLTALASHAWANPPAAAPAASPTDRVVIPARSVLHQFRLTRAVTQRFNDSTPTARLAAQLHQESRWRHDAVSPAGAQGLAQFMPATAAWINQVCPDLGPEDPWSPDWSIRAQVCYMHWLHSRVEADTACDRWAFAFSDYNGGTRWRLRDQRMAREAGRPAGVWFDQVETFRSRGPRAHAENRAYVRRILMLLEPAYIAAGWPGVRACG